MLLPCLTPTFKWQQPPKGWRFSPIIRTRRPQLLAVEILGRTVADHMAGQSLAAGHERLMTEGRGSEEFIAVLLRVLEWKV